MTKNISNSKKRIWPRETGLTLIQEGHVFAPANLGKLDLLLGGGKILQLGSRLEPPTAWEDLTVVRAEGMYVFPGFIDPHIHIAGGGGEGGPATRNFDIQLSDITKHGVTTVVGVLGVDSTSKSLSNILGRLQGLEKEGISAYAWAGSYLMPPPTITGDVTRDIAYIAPILGVKIAISDHRCSHPTHTQILQLAAQARMGGLIGGKPGLLHLHVGQYPTALEPLFKIVESSPLTAAQFYPTHMNRAQGHLEQSLEWTRMGGSVDITAGISPQRGFPEAVKPSKAIRWLLEKGAPPENITMSSDANGNMIQFDNEGNVIGVVVQSLEDLFNEFRALVLEEGLPIENVLPFVSLNAAKLLKLSRDKGNIIQGTDADLLIVDRDLQLHSLYARGVCMVKNGEPVVVGTFERHDN